MVSPTSAAETLSGKCIRWAGFAEGDIKEDQALTPTGLSPMQNEEFVGWSLLFGMSREIPLSDQHHAPSPSREILWYPMET